MSKLSLAARNMIVQTPEMQALVTSGRVGSDSVWTDGWVFDQDIPVILDDKSATGVVVFSESNWQEPNPHNTARFPLLNIDIWAAPTKDSQNSVMQADAQDFIEEIFNAIIPYFHTVNKDVPGNAEDPFIPYMGQPGEIRWWGTATEISGKTGVPIFSATYTGADDYRPVAGGNGAEYRRYRIGIETA